MKIKEEICDIIRNDFEVIIKLDTTKKKNGNI